MDALRIFEGKITRKTYDHTKEEERCRIRINEEMQEILQGIYHIKYSNLVRTS